MGQKTHPLGFRLGVTQKHRSQWFTKPKGYSQYLQEDQLIRDFLEHQLGGTGSARPPSAAGKKVTFLGDAGLSKTLLERRANRLFVEVHVAQPKIVTGEGGSRLQELVAQIQKIQIQQAAYRARLDYRTTVAHQQIAEQKGPQDIHSQSENIETAPVSFQVVQVAQPATDATLLAQKVAQQLEKRVAFRRIMKQTIQQAREAGVEGIKIQISGRLNGAEIARREWAREGRVPLHTLRADIDYCAYPAQTIYGLLGIKIWVYKSS